MSTVDKAFADNIKQHNGFYNGDDSPGPDNLRCVEITEYDNAFGGVGYGLTFDGQRNRYKASEFVGNPRRYWAYEGSQQ